MELKVNGIKMHYQIKGNGKPLLLIHGNGEDHQIFNQAVIKLEKEFTCYLPDSRNHGKSTKTKEISYQALVDDYVDFIKKLKLKNLTLYGFSDGGIIGLMIASQHPELVDKLIISGANLNPRGLKMLYYFIFRIVYTFTRSNEIKMMLVEPHITNEYLAKIKAKTLVLAGQKDMIKTKHTRQIHAGINNSKLIIIPKESHASYIVHSDKIAEYILNFKD